MGKERRGKARTGPARAKVTLPASPWAAARKRPFQAPCALHSPSQLAKATRMCLCRLPGPSAMTIVGGSPWDAGWAEISHLTKATRRWQLCTAVTALACRQAAVRGQHAPWEGIETLPCDGLSPWPCKGLSARCLAQAAAGGCEGLWGQGGGAGPTVRIGDRFEWPLCDFPHLKGEYRYNTK